MVVGVFPALKLGVLFIKQISKPLAQMFVSQAKNHPVFRTYFIIPPAQFYHWAEVKAKMYLMNLGKPTKVAKLNEAMAIELGANLMGEVIIFGIAGFCLILEYNRGVEKEVKKEEARVALIQKFSDDIDSLYKTTYRQENEIQRLQDILEQLASKSSYKVSARGDAGRGGNTSKPQETGDGAIKWSTSTDVKGTAENHVKETEDQSLIHRAIMYFQNEVRRDKLLDLLDDSLE